MTTAQQRYQALGRLKAGEMNKTEAKYAARLELLKRDGDVLEYYYEPVNLKLADKCFYRVDFMVLMADQTIELHEVKGFVITDDSLVKIKTAAAKFPFKFIMWQLIKGEWTKREF